jgi:hypothetical protein
MSQGRHIIKPNGGVRHGRSCTPLTASSYRKEVQKDRRQQRLTVVLGEVDKEPSRGGVNDV